MTHFLHLTSRRRVIVSLLAVCILGSACQASPTQKPASTAIPATSTALPATNTPAPTASSTPLPTQIPQPQVITAANAADLKLTMTLGRGAAEAFAWSPDGKYLAVAATTGIWLYDANTLEDIRHWDTGSTPVVIAVSPDGKTIATVGYQAENSPEIHLWDSATGNDIQQLEVGINEVPFLVFSPDGKTLASDGYRGDDETFEMIFWDIPSGAVHLIKPGKVYIARGLAFSPDGKYVALGGAGKFVGGPGLIEIWDLAANKSKYIWQHAQAVTSIAVSPDGSQVASASNLDANIKLWNMDDGSANAFRAASGKFLSGVDAMAFSPDGKRMAIIGEEWDANYVGPIRQPVYQWDLAGKKNAGPLEGTYSQQFNIETPIAYSPSGDKVAALTVSGRLLVWDTTTGKLLPSLLHDGPGDGKSGDAPFQESATIAISPDDSLMAVGFQSRYFNFYPNDTGDIALWDTRVAKLHGILHTPTWSGAQVLTFSQDGKQLVQVSNNFGQWTWDMNTLLIVNSDVNAQVRTRGAVVTPDGHWLAVSHSGIFPGTNVFMALTDLTGGSQPPARSLSGFGQIRAISPDGTSLALTNSRFDNQPPIRFLVSDDGWKTWKTPYPDLPLDKSASIRSAPQLVTDIAFVPQAEQAIICNNVAQQSQLWDLKAATVIRSKGSCNQVAFSPDGSVLALAGANGVRLYSPDLAQELGGLQGAKSQMISVAFSRDGKLLAGFGRDGVIYIYQVLQ